MERTLNHTYNLSPRRTKQEDGKLQTNLDTERLSPKTPSQININEQTRREDYHVNMSSLVPVAILTTTVHEAPQFITALRANSRKLGDSSAEKSEQTPALTIRIPIQTHENKKNFLMLKKKRNHI